MPQVREAVAVNRTHQDLVWTPRAKGRPRTTFKAGANYRTFTPRATVEAERNLRDQWDQPIVQGPIAVGLMMSDTNVGIHIIESPDCTSRYLKRGDIDNYAKLIMDALNGVAWVDDRQIVSLSVRKM